MRKEMGLFCLCLQWVLHYAHMLQLVSNLPNFPDIFRKKIPKLVFSHRCVHSVDQFSLGPYDVVQKWSIEAISEVVEIRRSTIRLLCRLTKQRGNQILTILVQIIL